MVNTPITVGCIKPFIKKYKKITIVQIDAHADLRNMYNNEKFSHASAMRRCLDNKKRITNFFRELWKYLKK